MRTLQANGYLDSFLKTRAVDIICFQETKLTRAATLEVHACLPGYEGYFSFSETHKGYSGTATFVRKGVPFRAAHEGLDEEDLEHEGRVVRTDHGSFVLFNVYCPNGGAAQERLPAKLSFFARLQRACSGLVAAGRRVIVAGDVNVAREELDLKPSLRRRVRLTGFLPEERDWFTGFLNVAEFVDAFRVFHPGAPECYTHDEGWRLDYFLVSKALAESGGLVGSEILLDAPLLRGSDHRPILLRLDVSKLGSPTDSSAPTPQAATRKLVPTSAWPWPKKITSFFAKKPAPDPPATIPAAAPAVSVASAPAAHPTSECSVGEKSHLELPPGAEESGDSPIPSKRARRQE